MLSNAYFLANFRFDTAENEPAKNFANFEFSNFLPIFENSSETVWSPGPQPSRSPCPPSPPPPSFRRPIFTFCSRRLNLVKKNAWKNQKERNVVLLSGIFSAALRDDEK